MRNRFPQGLKWSVAAGAILCLFGLGIIAQHLTRLLPLVLGYKAKEVAAFVFIAQQPEEIAIDLVEEDDPSLQLVTIEIDHEGQQVHASLFGWAKRTAKFYPTVGNILLHPGHEIRIPTPLRLSPGTKTEANTIPSLSTPEPLERALAKAFAEPLPPGVSPKTFRPQRRTRAVLVFQDNHLIAERYAAGFSPISQFCGWSMTKSVMGLLTMMRIDDGTLKLTSKPRNASWGNIPTDTRNDITLAHLMQMTSGLEFTEDYSPTCDAVAMLYGQSDMAKYALEKPLVAPDAVGQIWQYSSGSANIVSQMFRGSFKGQESAHLKFPHERLFRPLGITNAVFEIDGSGTLVGSSFLFASARDWLQIGRLVLNKGRWNGHQLISEKALAFLFSKPEKPFPQHRYGGFWWLNTPYSENTSDRWMTDVPSDAIIASGHFGQALVIIPSLKLVIVRLGLSKGDSWKLETFLPSILTALSPTVSIPNDSQSPKIQARQASLTTN